MGPWLLVPLGLVGLVVLVRQFPSRMQALTWVAFVPLYAMSVAVFFVAERYRLPLLVPLCVGAGIALDAAAVQVARRDWRSLVGPALAAIALLVVVNWATQLDDGRWDEGLKLAQRFVILERHDEARSWVDRLESNAPRPGAAHAGVATQYFLRGDHTRAVPYFEQALRLDPGNQTIAHNLAEALLETGDPQRAVALLSNLTPGPDADVEVWLRLGRLAVSAQAPQIADKFFQGAVARQPRLAAARLQFGLNLLVQNRLPEAERELREASRLDPRDADAWAHLAYSQFGQGRLDDARRSAEAALGIDAGNTMARAIYERTR